MKIIAHEAKYVRRLVQESRIGDDLIIFDDRTGKYYSTGQVGADIWGLLSTPHSIDAICAYLFTVYTIDEVTCRSQVNIFLQQMVKSDLVECLAL